MSKHTEETAQPQKVGGLHIRKLNYGFIAALTVFAIVLFAVTLLLSAEYGQVNRIADNFRRVEQDSKMVQAASDDLTKDVQFFVTTGKKSYLNAYFTEANETKRREAAIEDIKQLHVTDDLIRYLQNAVNESRNLMLLEYRAMRYAAEGFALELSELPQEIQEIVLPAEAASLSPREKIQAAEEIVFGDEYLSYKSRIRDYESKYVEKSTELMEALEADGRQKMTLLLVTQWVVIFLIVAFGTILFMTILRLIVHPLDAAVSSISHGEKITPVAGVYEVRYMAQTYNEFHAHSAEAQKRLKQDAERDALTGVLNRRGYQTVIDKLASETYPLALLVFDVDEFKQVNDNYGHEVGDLALQKMAALLRDTFRTTDITSRIGGDEFTVIVLDVTEENKNTIAEKVRRINRALQTPGPDNCPALSASVGCAFSSAGYNSHAFSMADEKMYEAKKSGGGDIRFA